MLAIRLPRSIKKRLERPARRTGRTKTFYARKAILEHLWDLEDLYLAEQTLDRIRSGEERTIPLKDSLKRHGLARGTIRVRRPGTRHYAIGHSLQ
jgi:RHH-type rel operon transcriptional repressor/antitoxin RelB